MKNLSKTLLVLSVAGLASSMAFAGDDTGAQTTGPAVTLDPSTRVLPVNETEDAVKEKFAKTRFSEPVVNEAVNSAGQYFNATALKMDDLLYKATNASSWSVDEKGLGEITRMYAVITEQYNALMTLAKEKDPTVIEKLKAALRDNNLSSIADRVDRLEGIHGFAGNNSYEIDISDTEHTGFVFANLGGQKFNCTTEGYMKSTIADESWTVCVNANAGAIEDGSKQVYDVYMGYFFAGEKTVTVNQWPLTLNNPDWLLDLVNISPKNAKTAKYYNGIMLGGEHVNSKVFGNSPTVNAVPVITYSAPVVAKPAPKAPTPLKVEIINGEKNPVMTKEVK